MVRHQVADSLEPEAGELRQDLALVGDARPEHVIERRDPIGGDDQERGLSGWESDFVDVADLAAAIERQSFKGRFEQGSCGEHVDLAGTWKLTGAGEVSQMASGGQSGSALSNGHIRTRAADRQRRAAPVHGTGGAVFFTTGRGL